MSTDDLPTPKPIDQAAPGRSTKVFLEGLTIAVFLVLLWLPTADSFLGLDHAASLGENRMLAKAPKFNGFGRSREFVAESEAYFNDHFGFRNRLIQWKNHCKGQLFHDTTSELVMVGQEGWLFYSPEGMINHCLRQTSWTPHDLDNWRLFLEGRRKWLLERGIKYLFVVAPDKQTVYPEYLPDWLVMGTNESKVQQLAEYLQTCSQVEILNLGDTLMRGKQARSVFLKTDSHWNLFGGFLASEAVTDKLARQLPGLAPMSPDVYTWHRARGADRDLANILGLPELTETELEIPVTRSPVVNQRVLYEPLHCVDSTPMSPCYTTNELSSQKALVFRDSMATAWGPFLGQHFGKVLYVNGFWWDRELIEREKPDVVIDELVERAFNSLSPRGLPESPGWRP